jgi:cytochrome c oxidase cbb3-type subunit III
MSKKETDELLNHEYDGIRELDNPLPGWWLATFYATIVFAVLYVGYYHFGPGLSLKDELANDMAKLEERQRLAKKASPGPDEATLLAIVSDPAQMAIGKAEYIGKCASCHGILGEGSIGPNLTDKFWIHGDGSLVAIHQLVEEGVAEKGMPPWKAMLKPAELNAVVAFAHSLKGANPPNAKPPQGVEVKQ